MLKELKTSYYPYPSRRHIVYSSNGMVATSQPLATEVGQDILRRGGNAVDAAIAMAATLTVVEPTGNGIGGDAFALIWQNGKLHGLNASGPSPASLSLECLAERGHDRIPGMGVIPVTVPGAPAAWAAMSKRFGLLNFRSLFEGAIRIAMRGFEVQPLSAKIWHRYMQEHKSVLHSYDLFSEWLRVFTLAGNPPNAGDFIRFPDHAKSLQAIADSGARDFYEGDIADKIDRVFKAKDGFLSKDDLSRYKPQWVEPISTRYGKYDIHEIPPNGHGITVLLALNIIKQIEAYDEASTELKIHYQIEAMKLAFSDVKEHVADARYMKYTPEELLSDTYAKKRASSIRATAAIPAPAAPDSGGTVYLATADRYGNMVSFIQSNYMEFGSGIVIPGTGIAMHNRGLNFSMDTESANVLAGGKYPYHTIIPGFLTCNGKPVGPFGVMGGFMQPQGHFQVMLNTIDDHLNPQAALDKPRWQWTGGKTIELEHGFDHAIANDLIDRGHDIVVKADSSKFGRGQIIWRADNGLLCGGCEPRTDSSIGIV